MRVKIEPNWNFPGSATSSKMPGYFYCKTLLSCVGCFQGHLRLEIQRGSLLLRKKKKRQKIKEKETVHQNQNPPFSPGAFRAQKPWEALERWHTTQHRKKYDSVTLQKHMALFFFFAEVYVLDQDKSFLKADRFGKDSDSQCVPLLKQ